MFLNQTSNTCRRKYFRCYCYNIPQSVVATYSNYLFYTNINQNQLHLFVKSELIPAVLFILMILFIEYH